MTNQNKLTTFWLKFKTKKVFSIILVYATTAFILIQLAALIENSLILPSWFDTVITIALIIGFPVVVIFSWLFNSSSNGVNRTVEEANTEQSQVVHIQQSVPDKSIIVLPFDNLSPDPDQEYFSNGLTEEIITDLSYINDLLVISRSSAMTFKGTKKKISEIAGEVKVRYVLEGSVRKSGNNLRIVAQLIDSLTDTHLWAEKYTGTLDDIFDIQEKVSHLVSDSLKVKLHVGDIERISEHKNENLQIYECYLKARQDLWKYTEDSLTRAEQNLKNGLAHYGDNELLFAGLGQVYFQFYDSGIRYAAENINKAEEYTHKIFKLHPDSALGYRLSGLVKLKKENALKAFRDFQRSLSINPSDPETLFWYIFTLYFHIGQPEKTKPFIDKLLKIDPLTPANQGVLSVFHWMKGEIDKALFYIEKWVEMEPDSTVANWYLGQLLVLNEKEEATDFIENFWKKEPEGFFQELLMFFNHAYNGRKTEALKYFKGSIEQIGWNDFLLPWFIAGYFALIDEKEIALKWLNRVNEKGLINYPLISEIDPLLKNIRNEPGFKKLLKKVKTEWESFQV